MLNLLVVDDETSICQVLELGLRRRGHQVETATSGSEARRKLQSQLFDVIICDINLRGVRGDVSGIDLLEYVRTVSSDVPFVLMTGNEQLGETIIRALNLGADRYVVKSNKLVEELEHVVRRAEDYVRVRRERDALRREIRRLSTDNIIGQSPKMHAIFETLAAVADTQSTILISGESGTGKELVARAIHAHSARADKSFVSINCGGFPETLLESELFGYVKGAFTGAQQNKEGLFQAASGGSLFLDEIGEMSLAMQVKLLRVLQDHRVRPLGSTAEVAVDVRVIAATNKDLSQLVTEKSFREDLYYRISVIPVHVPPLRERREDIPLLAMHFLQRHNQQMRKTLSGIEEKTLECLMRYSWPGNVRELENAIERAVALETTEKITLRNLPEKITGVVLESLPGSELLPAGGIDLERQLAELQRSYLEAALQMAQELKERGERSGGARQIAADLLKLNYRSFRHYAKKHKL
ncbi:MAG: sigma-54-dependent transcriptional regulator [Terriglobia bacterium]